MKDTLMEFILAPRGLANMCTITLTEEQHEENSVH